MLISAFSPSKDDPKFQGQPCQVPFPCVVVVWESSKDTDLVAFGQAAAALGHHAVEDPQAVAVGGEQEWWNMGKHMGVKHIILTIINHISINHH